jgi:adenosylcobinamide-GDP ribazoletransferase
MISCIQFLHNELNTLLMSFIFYTRIPLKLAGAYKEQFLRDSVRYFPLIGLFVNGSVFLIYLLAHALFTNAIALLIAMIAGVLFTGAFHEDGFADCCDAFGGGVTRDAVLTIMKDSRIGTYGTLGLCLSTALKFGLLFELASQLSLYQFCFVLLLGGSLSRFMAITIIYFLSYVQISNEAKAKPVVQEVMLTNLFFAGVWALIPFIFLDKKTIFFLLPLFVTTVLAGRYFKERIGGYTGDCLGASQQSNELFIYLLFAGTYRYLQ